VLAAAEQLLQSAVGGLALEPALEEEDDSFPGVLVRERLLGDRAERLDALLRGS